MSRLSLATPIIAFVLTTGFARSQEPPPLTMLGLAPGVTKSALQEDVAKLGGKLECKTASANPRIADCTAPLVRGEDGRRWSLLASMVDGSAGIVLLKATVSDQELAQLTRDLVAALGRPNLRQQHDQVTYEWIRSGRSMRLASRGERGRSQVSVSLIDGAVLDGLGAH